MAELLKNMYNEESIGDMAEIIQTAYEPFQKDDFLKATMDETWEQLELKARVRRISLCLGKYLPSDYGRALSILDRVVAECCSNSFFGVVFPDFVEVYGQDERNWDLSMKALERYTPYSSSEFAVRPFIISHEERMMKQMYAWSKHENEHVRRLASEGSRPALPWGQALERYKKDPSPVLPILEQLKADPSLYVRKSVANNLNDISKTHPELVGSLARQWYGDNAYTDWIVKHGCRTLLKQGDPVVLEIFGYSNSEGITVDDFKVETNPVSFGDYMKFSFSISVRETTKVRLEYGIDYVKANGKRNRKIFQISELELKENEKKCYSKNHSFKDMTTRKHYPGIHAVTLIVNGVERGTVDFELMV